MTLRGDRYYLRRHIPSDIQPIVGRLEVWRSLKTDSLQTALRHMPRNAAKRFPKLRLRAASDLTRDQGDIELVSAANANAHLANFSSFLNWAVNEELLARNPMRGLRLPDKVAKKDKRHPFSANQLQMIFNSPLYRGCLDGERP